MVLGGLDVVLKSGTRFVCFLSFSFNSRFLYSFMLMYIPNSKLDDFDKIGKMWLEVCAEVAKELDLDQS